MTTSAAHLALLLESVHRNRADTLDNPHRLWIRKFDLWRPDGTYHVSPIVARCLFEGFSWLWGFVLVQHLPGFAPLGFGALLRGALLVCLFLHSFLFVRALVIRVVFLRFGVWILVFGTEDAFVILQVAGNLSYRQATQSEGDVLTVETVGFLSLVHISHTHLFALLISLTP